MVVKTRQQLKREFEESDDESIKDINPKKYKPNEEAKILNYNFKDSLIKEIIQNTTRQLLKKYNLKDDYEDHINNNIDKEKVVEKTKRKLVRDYKNEIINEETSENSSFDLEENEEYDEFFENIDAIHSGTFFERIPIEEREKEFVKKFSKQEVLQLNNILKDIRSNYKKTRSKCSRYFKIKYIR